MRSFCSVARVALEATATVKRVGSRVRARATGVRATRRRRQAGASLDPYPLTSRDAGTPPVRNGLAPTDLKMMRQRASTRAAPLSAETVRAEIKAY